MVESSRAYISHLPSLTLMEPQLHSPRDWPPELDCKYVSEHKKAPLPMRLREQRCLGWIETPSQVLSQGGDRLVPLSTHF